MLNDRLRLRAVLWCCKKWLYVKFRSLYGGKPESFINRPSRFEQADPGPTASLTFASLVIYAARKILCAQQWRYAICHRSRVFRSPTSVSLWIRGWKKPQSKKSDATRVIVGSATFHMEKLANAWRAVTSFALRPRWKAVPTFCRRRWHRGCRLWLRGFQD